MDCIFFAVDILIYLPFVKVYDNQMLAKEAAEEEKIEESEAEPETETKQVQTEQ